MSTATNIPGALRPEDEKREGGDRIGRLRERYQNGPAFISVERARFYTASWRETEGRGLAPEVRIALAMKHVYENINIHLDPDDRIAGYWCEYFLGIPIDIERGVFNSVLEAELDKAAMVRFRAGAMVGMMLISSPSFTAVVNPLMNRISGSFTSTFINCLSCPFSSHSRLRIPGN